MEILAAILAGFLLFGSVDNFIDDIKVKQRVEAVSKQVIEQEQAIESYQQALNEERITVDDIMVAFKKHVDEVGYKFNDALLESITTDRKTFSVLLGQAQKIAFLAKSNNIEELKNYSETHVNSINKLLDSSGGLDEIAFKEAFNSEYINSLADDKKRLLNEQKALEVKLAKMADEVRTLESKLSKKREESELSKADLDIKTKTLNTVTTNLKNQVNKTSIFELIVYGLIAALGLFIVRSLIQGRTIKENTRVIGRAEGAVRLRNRAIEEFFDENSDGNDTMNKIIKNHRINLGYDIHGKELY